MSERRLSAAQARALSRDGYVVLRGLIPRPRVDDALREINRRLGLERAPRPASRDGRVSPAEMSFASRPLLNLLLATPAWGLARALIGPRVDPPTEAQVVLRFPLVDPPGWRPGFHIDEYVPADAGRGPVRVPTFTLLYCVLLSDVPAPACGAFTVCPGSHRLAHRHLLRHGAGALDPALPERLPLRPGRAITGRAGDVVLCHYLLAHDRQPNLSPHIRYAAFFRLRKAGHLKRQRRALLEPWSEWAF